MYPTRLVENLNRIRSWNNPHSWDDHQPLFEGHRVPAFSSDCLSYHGTSTTFIPSIMHDGILPDQTIKSPRGKATLGSIWSYNYGLTLADAEASKERYGGNPVIVIGRIHPDAMKFVANDVRQFMVSEPVTVRDQNRLLTVIELVPNRSARKRVPIPRLGVIPEQFIADYARQNGINLYQYEELVAEIDKTKDA